MSLDKRRARLRANRNKRPEHRASITSDEVQDLIRESDFAVAHSKRVTEAADELKRRTRQMMDEMGI
jgi:hypothetical protein